MSEEQYLLKGKRIFEQIKNICNLAFTTRNNKEVDHKESEIKMFLKI